MFSVMFHPFKSVSYPITEFDKEYMIWSLTLCTSVHQGSEGANFAVRDEIDMEFLGHTDSSRILLNTNYYSQGRGQDTHEEGVRKGRLGSVRFGSVWSTTIYADNNTCPLFPLCSLNCGSTPPMPSTTMPFSGTVTR